MTPGTSSDDGDRWQQFLDNQYPNAHLLQTSTWGQLKSGFGWSVTRVQEGRAGAQILFRKLPLGFTIGYIPKGPVGPWLPDLLPAMDALCRQRGAFVLKIEADERWGLTLGPKLEGAGFRSSPHGVQPKRTILVDLRPDEEDILAAMHQKTRYNIRLSARKGVTVRPWADVDAFIGMMEETANRHDFGTHVPAYYRQAYELFEPTGACQIFVAELEGEPLASLMAFARGERAWYFYGASSGKERSRMPTYGLQWAAIRWAKSRGCKSYDLWGIPDADEETLEAEFTERSDGLWGVYRFKRGFGEVQRFAGAWDRVYQPLPYLVYSRAAGRLLS